MLANDHQILVTWILKRYNNELQTSEMFSTAGRTVKSGLVASAVVSSWTWAATLLQSSGIAYRYGVSGPFWYASGATVQIILFATIAIELKRRAPNAHVSCHCIVCVIHRANRFQTFLEVIKARYGTEAHIVFIVFGVMTNILVTAMLLTGGSAVVTALTGMPTPAACFLLPLGVVMYTMFGGIKATFLTVRTQFPTPFARGQRRNLLRHIFSPADGKSSFTALKDKLPRHLKETYAN
jgi:Na+/proline symporter